MHLYADIHQRIVEIMKSRPYWDRVMNAGSELDRVKQFLHYLSGEETPAEDHPHQNPRFLPMFPGLNHEVIRDSSEYPWAQELETAYHQFIKKEAMSLDAVSAYQEFGLLAVGGVWGVSPLYYMGVNVELFSQHCPETLRLVESFPRGCHLFPLADTVFSRLEPGTKILPHCSYDNMAIRCHLGIQTPKGAVMNIVDQQYTWEEGRVFVFEDSFIHDVHNGGDHERVVLILDFWHPDITDVEMRVLTAGFRKSEVRQSLFHMRLGDSVDAYRDYLFQKFLEEDQEDLIREFWE